MSATQRGSAFLLCLALSAMAVMIGYAFLRAVARQDMTGRSQQLISLAQTAARSGAAHAMEMILRDYNATSLVVAQNSGSVTVSPVPTHLDGMYRAQFVSWRNPNCAKAPASPYDLEDVSTENPLVSSLMRLGHTEDPAGYHLWNGNLDSQAGFIIYDGRGRWIEMNYHNVTRPLPTTLIQGPSLPVQQPVQPTSFVDPSAAPPERNRGLFLGPDLTRLQSGTPAQQRQKARFRLRYAIGVEDLMGHLLINPRADMNTDWTDPNNDYRTIPPWVEQGGHMLDGTIANWQARENSDYPDRTMGLRLGHIFRGRGQSDNADRKASGTRVGLPATFPLMFRQAQYPAQNHPWYGAHDYSPTSHINLGGRLFGFDNTMGGVNTGLYPNIPARAAGGEILTPVGGSQPTAKNAIRPYTHALIGPQQSWFNLLFSIAGIHPATGDIGLKTDDGYWWQGGRYHNYAFGWARWWHRINTNYALHGRSMQAAPATAAANRTWYQGECDTAWQVNLLTATTQTLSSMILTYLPPYTKVVHYEKERWFRRIAINIDPFTGAKSDVFSGTPTDDFETNNNPIDTVKTWQNAASTLPRSATPTQRTWDTKPWAVDPFTDLLGPGFSEFPAPSSTDGAGNVVKPDFYQAPPAGYPQNPPESRYFDQCYPGPAVRADPQTTPPEHSDGKLMTDPTSSLANFGYGFDDLGALINVDTALGLDIVVVEPGYTAAFDTRGWCATTYNPITYFGGLSKGTYETFGPNAAWPEPGNRFRIERYVSTTMTQATAKNSYFWDLASALSATISYARGTWDQYPTDDKPEASHFNAHLDSGKYRGWQSLSLRDPMQCNTIEKIDSLFLRNLGENFDNPGTVARQNPIVIAERGMHSFWVSPVPVSHTIRSLVTGDLIKVVPEAPPGPPVAIASTERGKVMERVLNDYRMSFFGASPQYSLGVDDNGHHDATHGFRPLDFDGDGKVVCSGYPRRGVAGGATAAEVAYCTDRWMPVDASHPKPGRGPRPTNWFSVTGCFFIGKSHYYRIFVRGEVYDNLLRKPVAQQDLETVYCVDPEAPLFPATNRVSPEQRVLFQQWRLNQRASELPAQRR